jgi:uncharacterized protein (TIGR02594 family)
MNTQDIQNALKAKGFDPGPVDGVSGRMTISAIKAFQAKNGLEVDGIVGPNTAAKLFGQDIPKAKEFEIPVTMPWLQEAHNLIGTQEQPGRGSNEAIIGWAKKLKLLSYSDDDIPWCGLFVAHCVGSQLPDEPLPTNPLRARAWQTFGEGTKPQLGAVMVFWRGSKSGGLGHVGFYWAEDDAAYQILGGNQSNAVTISRLAKNRLLQARWPGKSTPPKGITRTASKAGKLLSQNEA